MWERARDGAALALLAYLALASHEMSRSHLCDLLWDLPDDPRGELRWCLSKLRGVLDEPEHPRVLAQGDAVRLDLVGCSVDALEVGHALQRDIATLDVAALQGLASRFRGDFLEGLDIPRSPAYSAWLTAQRRRFRAAQAAVLERLALVLPRASGEAIGCRARCSHSTSGTSALKKPAAGWMWITWPAARCGARPALA